MPESDPASANVSERDAPALARYLLSFRWPYRNEAVHEGVDVCSASAE